MTYQAAGIVSGVWVGDGTSGETRVSGRRLRLKDFYLIRSRKPEFVGLYTIVRGPMKEHARCSRRGCSQSSGKWSHRNDFGLSLSLDPPLELLGAKPRSACSCRPFQIHVAAHRRQAYQIHARRMRLMERGSHQITCGRRHRMKDDRAS